MLNPRHSHLLSFVYTLAALIPQAYAHEEHHDHGHGSVSGMTQPPANTVNSTVPGAHNYPLDSYYLWKEDKALLYSHIVIMVISWVFVLPFGE